jgi:fatty acid-binding protein DegV
VIALVTDSNVQLPEELRDRFGVRVAHTGDGTVGAVFFPDALV